MQKVRKTKVHTLGRTRKFSYRDILFDEDGWADAKKYLPGDYDLVFLDIEGKPPTSGWSIGDDWDGLYIEKGDKVLYWKRKPDCGL